MKGVGSMRRLLSFIFAILIVVFAVMPNVYAEAQKDYGNLDMNRWVVIGSNDDSDVLIDKVTHINFFLPFCTFKALPSFHDSSSL